MRSSFWDEQNGVKFDFSFCFEMNPVQWIIIILGESFIELFVFNFFNIFFTPCPNSFVIIDNGPFSDLFFYSFSLFLFFFFLNISIVYFEIIFFYFLLFSIFDFFLYMFFFLFFYFNLSRNFFDCF